MTGRIANLRANGNLFEADTGTPFQIDIPTVQQLALAPGSLRDRFRSSIDPTIASEMLIHLSRVRFSKRNFEFDEEGRWAVVVPIVYDGEIWNWAAFASDDDDIRRTYRLGDFAVGLEDAILDARLHPQARVRIFHSIWTWLQDGGRGLLPVDWRATALFLMHERYDLVANSRSEGELIRTEFERATRLPGMFLRKAGQP